MIKNGRKLVKNQNYLKNIDGRSLLLMRYGKRHKKITKTFFNSSPKDGEEHETIMIDDDMHYKCMLNEVELLI